MNTRTEYGKGRTMWILDEDYATKFPVSHLMVKGDVNDAYAEVGNFTHHEVREEHLDTLVNVATEEVLSGGLPMLFGWEDYYDSKNKEASPGEPYRASFSTFRQFIDHVGEDVVREGFEELEAQILSESLNGDNFEVTFLVHVKKDGYNLKRLMAERFRTIQGSDCFLNYLMYRYMGWASKACTHSRTAMTSFRASEFGKKLFERVGLEAYLSVDFSGFDRKETANVIETIIRRIGKLGRTPQAIIDFIVEAVCYGALTMPDGKVLMRFGGNPSGQYLTTVVNTIYHFAIVKGYERKFQVTIRKTACGDDGVYGGSKALMEFVAETYPEYVITVWGITTKFETSVVDEGNMVHEFPDIPVFLGRNLGFIGRGLHTYAVPLLTDTTRVLKTIISVPAGETHQQRMDRIRGVYEALSSYKLLLAEGLDLAPNVTDFLARAESQGVPGLPSMVSIRETFLGKFC